MPSDTPPSRVKKAWRMFGEAREGAWIMCQSCREAVYRGDHGRFARPE